MTNAMIIFNESVKLMEVGIIRGTGRFVEVEDQNGNKFSFRIAQAESDIQHQQTRLSQIFALLDIAEAEQAAALPGSRQDIAAQKQIIALENQIAACERRLSKAEFDKATAEQTLAA